MVVWLLAACGPPKGSTSGGTTATPEPAPLPPRPLAEVYVLEASGAQPEDTVVTVQAGEARVVVIRRSAPDFGVFAQLHFPDSTLKAAGGQPVKLTISPRPSLYGLDLEVQGTVAPGASIVFSYGAHFVAPAGARQRYGSNLAFEKELAIGRLSPDGQVIFLPTTRPGSDMLRAPLSGPGRYIVGAPH